MVPTNIYSISSESPLRSGHKIQEPDQGGPDLEGSTAKTTGIDNEGSTEKDFNYPPAQDAATGHTPNPTHTFAAGERRKEGAMLEGPRKFGTEIGVPNTGITLHSPHVQLVTLDTYSPHPSLTRKKPQNATKKEDFQPGLLKVPAKSGTNAPLDSKVVMLGGRALEQILSDTKKTCGWAEQEPRARSEQKMRKVEAAEVGTTLRKRQQKSILSAFWCQFIDCILFPETILDLFVILLVFRMVHIMIFHKPITDSALVVEWFVFRAKLVVHLFVEFIRHSFFEFSLSTCNFFCTLSFFNLEPQC